MIMYQSILRKVWGLRNCAVNLKAVGILRTNDIKADVICIEPHVSLGSFLLFDKEVIHRNIQLGYQDTLKKI